VSASPRFHGRLTLSLIGENCGRPVWRVESALTYWSPVLNDSSLAYADLLTIPVGLETDLASVPRVPVAWLLAGGRANGPAVVHDYLYAMKWPSKALADSVFLEAMGVDEPELGFVQVSAPKRWLMYTMVKLFGGSAWAALDAASRRSLGLPAELPP
jgi:hypothetical protein